MDVTAVITNPKTKQKYSYSDPNLLPKFSIIDPSYSYTISKAQLVSGSIDIISHILEEYFSEPNYTTTSDYLAEALLKSVIHNIELSLADPNDYRQGQI